MALNCIVIGSNIVFTCIVKKQKGTDKKGFVPLDEKKVRQLFGKRINELRKRKGYKGQMVFAFEKGLNVRRYSAWEKGEDIKLSNIVRVCNALEIPIDELFREGFM